MPDSDDDSPPELVDVASLRVSDSQAAGAQQTEELQQRVPITIVTGFLGAGKTTLLNGVLRGNHGKRIAVILNEFGDSADIEKSLTVNNGGEEVQEWLDVGNGCICCSVKDSGIQAIEQLMEKKGRFDYILLETTGLADPGNLAPIFWMDHGLGSSIYLDGIVTVIDAKHIAQTLDEGVLLEQLHGQSSNAPNALRSAAHLQISNSDVIVLNKSDLVSRDELRNVTARIQSINGIAEIHQAQFGEVSPINGLLLDLHAYDRPISLTIGSSPHGHIDPAISTISFGVPQIGALGLEQVDKWLRCILWSGVLPGHDGAATEQAHLEIFRLKGRLWMMDGSTMTIQGVRELFECIQGVGTPEEELEAEHGRSGKIVVIGKNLRLVDFRKSFLANVETAQSV